MFGNCFSPNLLLVARVLREGENDSTCDTSPHTWLPTWCTFKLLCVAERGADAHPCDKPLVEGGSCTPLLSWCVSCVIGGGRWILTVLSLVWLRARLSHCLTSSWLDFVLPWTCSALPAVWHAVLNGCFTFVKQGKSSMQALVTP